MRISEEPVLEPVEGESASIFSDKVALLYASLPLALATILINGTVLSLVMWDVADSESVITWFSLTLAVTTLRFSLLYAFRHKKTGRRDNLWLNLFLLGALASGMLWGSTGFFFFSPDAPTHQLFVVFVVGGMAAGAVTTLSASFRAIMLFLLPAMLPLIALLLTDDSTLNKTMGGMMVLFLAMLSVTARRASRLVIESLERQYARERAEATIQYQACHDNLTRLPNRRLLVDRLEQEIARCIRHKRVAAVLFIDIDRFKTINDSLGHAVGDALLRDIAARLKGNIRKEDTAARLGGDEFILLLSELGQDETLAAGNIRRRAERIGQLVSETYQVDGHTLHATCSIGIALCPADSTDADEIIKQADIAMYRAKELGRNTVQFYLPEMQVAIHERLALENDLRVAVENNEMELCFQPQLNADGRVTGAEVLLRWNHPQRGLVLPGEFIPVAEETGMIQPLGEWVLYSACAQLKCWMDAAGPDQLTAFTGIAINVSPGQFRQKDFIRRVKDIISQTGVNPRYVELELTEGMLTRNIEDTAEKMEQLTALGIKLSIDDFGTGYSSLYYLKHLRLDRIKIDQSFVRDIHIDPGSATIVQTIISMAHGLGLGVIAEGVESEQELAFLRERGCDAYQGHYFSKPLSHDSFLSYLLADDSEMASGGVEKAF